MENADRIFKSRKSGDLDYLQPEAEKILEQQHQGYLHNELWVECCADAAHRGKKSYRLSRFNESVSEYQLTYQIITSPTVSFVPVLLLLSVVGGISV